MDLNVTYILKSLLVRSVKGGNSVPLKSIKTILLFHFNGRPKGPASVGNRNQYRNIIKTESKKKEKESASMSR